MSESWASSRLGDLTVNLDSRRRPIKASERISGAYPYYGASGIIDSVDGFLYEGLHLLIAEDGENLRSRTTPIAFLADGQFWVNNHAHVVTGNERADTRFLSYALNMLDISGYLTGSTQPKLTRSALDSLILRTPETGVQRAIAEVLGALDDKIAGNRSLCAAIDSFLFEYFELFITGETVPLKEIGHVNAKPVKLEPERRIRYVDIASLGVGTYQPGELTSWEEVPSRARRGVERGDTLWSTVRPNRRAHALILSGERDLIVSTGIATLSPVTISPAHLYEATRRPQFVQYLESVAEGSAYPAVSSNGFLEAPIAMLSQSGKHAFETTAEYLRELAAALSREEAALTELRDALLPALMSGKLRVKDAERAVEDVL